MRIHARFSQLSPPSRHWLPEKHGPGPTLFLTSALVHEVIRCSEPSNNNKSTNSLAISVPLPALLHSIPALQHRWLPIAFECSKTTPVNTPRSGGLLDQIVLKMARRNPERGSRQRKNDSNAAGDAVSVVSVIMVCNRSIDYGGLTESEWNRCRQRARPQKLYPTTNQFRRFPRAQKSSTEAQTTSRRQFSTGMLHLKHVVVELRSPKH